MTLRHFFSFLFRHDWQSTGEYSPDGMVRDRCKNCGKVSDWRYLIDQHAFGKMYRQRGCRGK